MALTSLQGRTCSVSRKPTRAAPTSETLSQWLLKLQLQLQLPWLLLLLLL